ncbi:MAG TPA: M20/M25/M40 family metallo-hydrolase [Magnetospirillaceae bacterium]|nr:M20/M25/M40 family metallo-hydrolase [Magnetospirillaceae bacterium]
MKTLPIAAALLGLLAGGAHAEQIRPDQAAFRSLYKELVETNTTLSAGDCTLAAKRMAEHLKKAGYAESDLRIIVPDGQPRFGALIATLGGTDAKAKAILLLAHIDVVEAKREDWQRDPFTLIEENGYFYGRGSSDDKAMAAVFADMMVRFKQEGFKPKRPLKLALTCGEETPDNFNSVAELTAKDPKILDAAFGLNEGAGGRLDKDGNRIALEIQAGEKVYQDFALETVNPGGHSSRPRHDNAIYELTAGLDKLAAFDFPVIFNPVTKAYFAAMAEVTPGPVSRDLTAVAGDKPDAEVLARISQDPSWNSTLRTTCVATMIEGGHAPNALAQHAKANVNCRILPGTPIPEVQKTLQEAVADPGIKISTVGSLSPVSPPPPLTDKILGPVKQVAAKMWPGVPLIPTMATGATDGRFLNAAGVPIYGLSGMFRDPDGSGVHGLNERIRVRSLYEGRDFLTEVVKIYATDI